MFVIAINPETFDPDHRDRVDGFVDHLSTRWSIDVSVFEDPVPTYCVLDPQVVERLQEAAAHAAPDARPADSVCPPRERTEERR